MEEKDKKDPKKDLNKEEVRKELYGDLAGSKRGRGRTPAEQRAAYAKYRATKKKVIDMEARNDEHIVLFPASDADVNEKKFYKMGGTSAIIYVHDLAKRTKRKATLRRDFDNGNDTEKFHSGVCSVLDMKAFDRDMKTLGLTLEPKFPGCEELVIYKLPRKYPHSEVKEMLKEEQKDIDRLNRTIYAKVLYPEVHKPLLELKRAIPSKVKNMDKLYREVVGNKMVDSLLELLRTYSYMAHGDLEEKEAARKMCLEIDMILEMVSLMNEIKVWDVSACLRVADIAVGAKIQIKGRILGEDEAEG